MTGAEVEGRVADVDDLVNALDIGSLHGAEDQKRRRPSQADVVTAHYGVDYVTVPPQVIQNGFSDISLEPVC